MSVSQVSNNAATGGASGGIAANDAGAMKDEFLQLMVAQINNQDPLNPLDGTQYLSQLAQLSTVEGIQNLGSLQTQGNTLMDTLQVLQSTQLVGKQVSVPVQSLSLDQAESLTGKVRLDQSAEDLRVRVTDAAGNLVQEKALGPQQAGDIPFSLDELPAGLYQFEVVAKNGDASQSLSPFLNRTVEKVSIPANGGDIQLQVAGLGNLSLFSVSEFLGEAA
ncbi:flagellar hook capping FlgD N-terminal domain-containing protein [Gallaecimonas kandeliae]|uniref:flagellar hook assembly protein FlgD n=1 Tax=Gallaecimonas kandeliae TaxID=3029055 RepID=UPI0026480119|nr:flagellar hook capping FlgD N-terminal domain-containing protein [Gallaecimonas kandeliae]WKE66530.1 flagellar hook capping FlgD N-terminal domain-containing protein [Gallaecimonas kandeliae]